MISAFVRPAVIARPRTPPPPTRETCGPGHSQETAPHGDGGEGGVGEWRGGLQGHGDGRFRCG